jgi:hypothetical protein
VSEYENDQTGLDILFSSAAGRSVHERVQDRTQSQARMQAIRETEEYDLAFQYLAKMYDMGLYPSKHDATAMRELLDGATVENVMLLTNWTPEDTLEVMIDIMLTIDPPL